MNPRTPLFASASLIAALLTAGTFAQITPPPADVPTTAATTAPVADDEPEQVRLSVGREGEYDAMLDDIGVAGAQRAAFNASATRRIATLQAFVDSPDGVQLIALREKLAQARRDRKSAETALLREEQKALSDKYWAVRNEGRRELMRLLTEPQLKSYVGYMLELRTVRRVAPRAKMTDEQLGKARAICDEAAAAWFKMPMVEADPYFRGLTAIEPAVLERITRDVLTPEQRAMLAPATRPTTRRG